MGSSRQEYWSGAPLPSPSYINTSSLLFVSNLGLGEVAQLCPALCYPMEYSPRGFSVHGIFQAIILEWVAISFSRRSFDQGVEPRSPVLQVFFTT